MPATTHEAPTPAAKQRDPWFDNAKMALVTLVVLGHAWTLLPHTWVNDTLYDGLYAWHMPAFVFVTGFLSRSFSWESGRMWRLVRTVAVPYFVFESALALFRIHVGGETMESLFTDPHWPMWYLAALFFWRLLTPVFTPMPTAVALVVAVATSLIAGVWAGDTLDVARILGLLPFFVMGLKATPERLALLRTPQVKRWAGVVLLSIFVLAIWTDTWASTEYLYYRARYDEVSSSDLTAMLTRATLLVVGTLGAWSFLSLVPRVHGWFTRMGAWTLVVYLFHGFLIKGLGYAGYADWSADHAVVSWGLTSVGALAWALFLASPWVAPRLNHVVDPLGTVEGKVRKHLEDDEASDVEERESARVG